MRRGRRQGDLGPCVAPAWAPCSLSGAAALMPGPATLRAAGLSGLPRPAPGRTCSRAPATRGRGRCGRRGPGAPRGRAAAADAGRARGTRTRPGGTVGGRVCSRPPERPPLPPRTPTPARGLTLRRCPSRSYTWTNRPPVEAKTRAPAPSTRARPGASPPRGQPSAARGRTRGPAWERRGAGAAMERAGKRDGRVGRPRPGKRTGRVPAAHWLAQVPGPRRARGWALGPAAPRPPGAGGLGGHGVKPGPLSTGS